MNIIDHAYTPESSPSIPIGSPGGNLRSSPTSPAASFPKNTPDHTPRFVLKSRNRTPEIPQIIPPARCLTSGSRPETQVRHFLPQCWGRRMCAMNTTFDVWDPATWPRQTPVKSGMTGSLPHDPCSAFFNFSTVS